jgi:hypothetical protein
MPEHKQTLFSLNQPNQPNRPVQFNKTCQLNPNHGIAKMRPTPPSPPANETPPAQSNGHAHGDGSAIYPPPLTVAEPTYDGNGDLMDPDRHYVTDHLGYQYPWSPNRDSDGIRLIPGTPAWQANQQIEVNARNRVRSSGSGSGHTTSGNTAVATTERSSDENDSMSDTDETGDEYLSSANHSPGGTLPTPSTLLERQLQQGAAAPITGDSADGNTPHPSNTVVASTESTFRHAITNNSNTTSLTSANLTSSALLERGFFTPANLVDAGQRTPSAAATGLLVRLMDGRESGDRGVRLRAL